MFNEKLKSEMHSFICSNTVNTELRGLEAYLAWMSVFSNKSSPLCVKTEIVKPKRWSARNLEYSASSKPIKFEGPIWCSSFPMMFPTILCEKFGHIYINEYSLSDIIDTLKEMRKEYKKQQALFHLEQLKNNVSSTNELASKAREAQYTCKAILNCLYGYIITRADFDNIEFEMEVQRKFDDAAKTIITNGGIILHASVDTFIYKSELPITFDDNQHNDKFSNIAVFDRGYATDIGKSSRLFLASLKAIDRFSREQAKRFLK